jgi:hypothetical protein
MVDEPLAAEFGAGDRVAVEDPSVEALASNEGVVAEVRHDDAVLVALAGVGTFPFPADCLRMLERAPAAAVALADAEAIEVEPKRQVWAGEIVTYHHAEGDRPAMVLRFDGMSRPWLALDLGALQFEGKLRLDLAIDNRSLILNAIEGTGPGQWSR